MHNCFFHFICHDFKPLFEYGVHAHFFPRESRVECLYRTLILFLWTGRTVGCRFISRTLLSPAGSGEPGAGFLVLQAV